MADNTNQGTDYVVLLAAPADNTWMLLDRVRAHSETAAKRKALAVNRPEGGTVVAIPARSWKPEDLKPKLSFI